jgi:RES domain-containing protein
MAAHTKGVRIAERTLRMEQFVMELRWKLRVLENADAEDRQYMGLSEASVIAWAQAEVTKLEEEEKRWAEQKGKVFVGRV